MEARVEESVTAGRPERSNDTLGMTMLQEICEGDLLIWNVRVYPSWHEIVFVVLGEDHRWSFPCRYVLYTSNQIATYSQSELRHNARVLGTHRDAVG